jgi:transcriptional regulator with XRE-family HTH domain
MTEVMTGRSPARSPNLDGSPEDASAEASAPARSAPSPADLAFGRRIRQRRKAKGLSIADLAGRAGVSTGALSQIERGLSSPTIRQLWVLSSALEVSASALVAPEDAALPDPYVTRHEREQPVIFERDGLRKRRISAAANAVFQGLMVEIEPDRGSGGAPYTHDADEIGYVIDGTIDLEIDGKPYRLGPGDCFAFSSRLPHRFHNPGPRPARVIWVIAKTG